VDLRGRLIKRQWGVMLEVTPTSHPTVSLSTCLSDLPTGSSSGVPPVSPVPLSTCLIASPTTPSHFVPLIAVASKCNRQENEIDESNVSKEDMKDEYNETIADVDDGTMSEAPTVSLSTCLSDPPTGSSSLVTPTSHCTVSINLPLRSTN
jgi:hypothetical protein